MAAAEPPANDPPPAAGQGMLLPAHVAELRAILVASVSLTVATSALAERLGREVEAIIKSAGLDSSELEGMIHRVRDTRATLVEAVQPVVSRKDPGK